MVFYFFLSNIAPKTCIHIGIGNFFSNIHSRGPTNILGVMNLHFIFLHLFLAHFKGSKLIKIVSQITNFFPFLYHKIEGSDFKQGKQNLPI